MKAASSTVKKWPTLYGVTSNGGTKVWNIRVERESDSCFLIVTEHGKLGGKMQADSVTITQGKNIGRANETTVQEQAFFDAESKWTKKRDRDQYTEQQPSAGSKTKTTSTNLFPMLALKFQERKHDIKWPAFVQPKLNGVRVLAFVDIDNQTVKFMSRKGKEYLGFDNIKKECLELVNTYIELTPSVEVHAPLILDGEFFNKDLSLQEITSRVKQTKKAHPQADQIQYHVYDIAEADLFFGTRLMTLNAMFGDHRSRSVFLVETDKAMNEKEVVDLHKHYAQEFEGVMVRNVGGRYKFGHRSADLQKLKEFIDEEFEIVDVNGNGVGREEGLALFVCKTDEGNEFTVRPRGSFEHRRELLADRKNLIGKQLTVRFLEWSADKIPQHPIGIVVRDYE